MTSAPTINGAIVVPPSPTIANSASPHNSQNAPASSDDPNGIAAPSTPAAGFSTAPPQQQPSSHFQPPQPQPQQPPPQQQQQPAGSGAAPRPRDSRLIELLLTSAGVTSYEPRVPLLLLDFAYRHTSSVLTDALHHSYDPYTMTATKSGGSGSFSGSGSGSVTANPPPGTDASVSHSAIKLAVASRLNYQYRGGPGPGGVGREFMQEVAQQRNSTALPRVAPTEWGVRLPSERFVLSGASWGLREDGWEEEEVEGMDEDAGEEVKKEKVKKGVEGDVVNGMDGDGGADGDEVMSGMNGGGGGGGGSGNGEGAGAQDHTEEDVDGGNDVEPGSIQDMFDDDIDEEMEE